MRNLNYPDPPRVKKYLEYHDKKVHDPYYYMEDPDDERAKEFVKKNNEIVFDFLDEDDIDRYESKLRSHMDYTRYYVPKKVGDKYFYGRNEGDQPQPIIYMREGHKGEDQVILDINELSEDGTTASMLQYYSRDGKYMAAYVSIHGSDWQKIIIKEIEQDKILEEELKWVTMGNIAFNKENTGFYYTRYPNQRGLSPEEQRRNAKLYFHRIGQPQKEDELIFAPDDPEEGPRPSIKSHGEHLFILLSKSTLPENKLLYYNQESEEVNAIIDKYDDSFYSPIEVIDNNVYILTSFKAPNNRVMSFNLDDNPGKENWEEVIPEQDAVLTEETRISNNKLVLVYNKDVKHIIQVYSLSGEQIDEIPLPTAGTLEGGKSYNPPIWTDKDDEEIIFGFSSFLYPLSIFSYTHGDEMPELWMDADLDINPDQFQVEQVFYESKDGTEIPMYLISKNGLTKNGKNPTLLYGYGGFNVSLLPNFSTKIYTWIEEGYLFAQPNLRGGGEYGKEWHEQALLEKKQNVFDDFISAGEWLIDNKYTSTPHLSINGRSNGGLLAAACLVQRPDLFGAVVPQVGVLDMLRYPHQKDAGRFWTGEYGSPKENKDHFEFLLEYSPYHNVEEGVKYPPTLITAAESDDRVAPMHSKKFGATLQHAQEGDAPILVRIETKAGHGYGKPINKIIEDTAINFAFLKQTIIGD